LGCVDDDIRWRSLWRKRIGAFFDYLRTAVEQDTEPESIGLIRSAFVEGNRIFPGSAICDKTHVQISVMNLDLIEHSCIYPTFRTSIFTTEIRADVPTISNRKSE
jgi:hypothetical protein